MSADVKNSFLYQDLDNARVVNRSLNLLRTKVQRIYKCIKPSINLASRLAIWIFPFDQGLYFEMRDLLNEAWKSGLW